MLGIAKHATIVCSKLYLYTFRWVWAPTTTTTTRRYFWFIAANNRILRILSQSECVQGFSLWNFYRMFESFIHECCARRACLRVSPWQATCPHVPWHNTDHIMWIILRSFGPIWCSSVVCRRQLRQPTTGLHFPFYTNWQHVRHAFRPPRCTFRHYVNFSFLSSFAPKYAKIRRHFACSLLDCRIQYHFSKLCVFLFASDVFGTLYFRQKFLIRLDRNRVRCVTTHGLI